MLVLNKIMYFRVFSCYMHTAHMMMKKKTNERLLLGVMNVVQLLISSSSGRKLYSVHVDKCPRSQTVVSMQLGQPLATAIWSMEVSAFQNTIHNGNSIWIPDL